MRHQIAQLRHAYSQLKLGLVRDQEPFADGLISPAIAEMERAADRIEVLEAALARIADAEYIPNIRAFARSVLKSS